MKKNKITAVLGPTNTGKTFLAIETMLSFDSGMMGFPLRLLAREVYDKIIKKISSEKVALITGEEKIIPSGAKYYLCTVESMPIDKNLDFVGIDEIQMCSDHERGHIFTERLLHLRGEKLTMFMGSNTVKNIISKLDGDIEFIKKDRFSKLLFTGHKKISRIDRKSAIIAFSTEEVYAIAELIRRQKGGAAIVMGSLSPKTYLKLNDSSDKSSSYSKMPLFQSGGGGLVSTSSDYHNFCFMLLNGGKFKNNRILSRKTIELMTLNHLPENKDMISFGSEGSFSEVRYKGVGFGLGFGVNIDVPETQNSGSIGSFNWGGAASTFFWIDPKEDLICIMMTQLMPSGYYPIRVQMQSMVYGSFID
jgi:hypothetical protein